MKRYISILTIFAVVLIFGFNTSCETLEVENQNLPDMERVLETPQDVKQVVGGAFQAYWDAIKTYNIGMTADVAADHTTVSWGNFAWQDMSWEPRQAWNNDPAYGESYLSEDVYYGLNAVISQVSDPIVLIQDGMEIGPNGEDNPMILATAHLIRGLSFGQIGLSFDKAMIPRVEEAEEVSVYLANLEFQPWNIVLEEAIVELEKAIEIADANEFAWSESTVPGVSLSNTYISQLASSYAARFLALGARTKAQNDDMSWTDKYSWADVLSFTNNGITADFAPTGNGLPWNGGSWYDLNIKYLRQPGWGRVDMRIINMLDSEQPVRYPTDDAGLPTDQLPPNAGEAVNAVDGRIDTDFEYLASNDFNGARGAWHFSHYRHSRYDDPPTTSSEGYGMGESIGPLFELRVYDNELMKAEAMVRANSDYAGAAGILNDAGNPRKDRGGLDDVAAAEEDVLNAIYYERLIELFHNGYLIGFCETRRHDDLQYGTPLHFPVPGKELMALLMDLYTYGGVNDADGVNTSTGGDWIKDEYHFDPSW